MSYFLSDKNLVLGSSVEIADEEARHILLAHRAKKGEKIKLQGPDGKRFLSEIVSVARASLSAKVLEEIPTPMEPAVAITLFQSVVNEKALDFIFQKGTELGLSRIVLFNSANTAAKLSQEKFVAKKSRWKKILTESAKQSERAKWPSLEFAVDVGHAMEKLKSTDKVFLADISGEKLQTINYQLKTLALIIGPEGGFTPSEIQSFKLLPNTQTLSLGSILLRAETAALAGMAIVQNVIK
ncbi:MAG: RsmE family RNA methyltransferase [Candidatus Paceibacterales bacterium]